MSKSSNPPGFDPMVMTDYYSPSYLDPRNAIPLHSVRKVVEAYLRSSGERPSIIDWVPGKQNGSWFS
ncbi:Imm1 family immunity protein [Streptomyces graminearus]|uniref:Imm1 family immunity protein n=1 Tax=Streptomyces graminearus TaxID=284030 RepID=UPI003D15BDD6